MKYNVINKKQYYVLREAGTERPSSSPLNKNYKKGISESIKFGVTQILKQEPDTEAILIILGDQPKISITYLNDFLNLQAKFPDKIIASRYEKSLGIPAIFPKTLFNNLKDLTGDKGAKDLLIRNLPNIITPKEKTDFFDIDTEQDYQHFLKNN